MNDPIPKGTIDDHRRERSCGCGVSLRGYPRYYHRCPYCHWSKEWQAIQVAEETAGSFEAQTSSLEVQISQIRDEIEQNEQMLPRILAEQPWWIKLLRALVDYRPKAEQNVYNRRWDLKGNLIESERALADLRRRGDKKKLVRKEYRKAVKAKEYRDKHNKLLAQREEAFASSSLSQIGLPDYTREKFLIRKVDYRRGNALDNHFRQSLFDMVVSDFGGQCLVCDKTDDLTLDHLAIPKNSGGNFVLWVEEPAGIQLNISVLCRSCNSSKNEKELDEFFIPDEITKILESHEILLRRILKDDVTMGVIRKWYKNGNSRRHPRRSNQIDEKRRQTSPGVGQRTLFPSDD